MRDHARRAVSLSFFFFGLTVGGLIPRVPALKEQLHLSDGQVGLALLGASLGGIAGALASRLVARRSGAADVRVAIVVLCAVATGPGLAPNLPGLVVTLFLVGFLWAFIDVLANAIGAGLELAQGRHLINGFHGFWSLGAFAGSLVAGLAASVGVGPLLQFIGTGALIAAGSLWFLRRLPQRPTEETASISVGAVSMTTAVIALGVLGFAAIIAEGGTSDWSALFLRELSHAGPGLAAAGFSGFSVAAMLVRFRADWVTSRTSRATVARIGSVMAIGGLALAIAFPALPTAIVGFTLVGMGTAVVLPLAFAASANLGPRTPLALVMASTYAGTIAGPPLIGMVADRFGLRVAMAIPLLAAIAVLLLAGQLGRKSVMHGQLGPDRRGSQGVVTDPGPGQPSGTIDTA